MTAARVGILPLEGFPWLEYALVIDPLKAANQLVGQVVYDCKTVSLGPTTISSDSGASLIADGAMREFGSFQELFVIGGSWDSAIAGQAKIGLLRASRRRGTRIYAIGSAVALLAQAGLLNNQTCAIPWEYREVLDEMATQPPAKAQLFTFSASGGTCIGRIATMDFMVTWLSAMHGEALGAAVMDRFAYEHCRPGQTEHWAAYRRLLELAGPGYAKIAQLMEENIAEPVPCKALARVAGLSPRQVQRWFSRYLGCGPQTFYRNLRLTKGLSLLRHSNLGISEIALATGFCSHTNFTRNFRRHYGFHPRDVRHKRRGELGGIGDATRLPDPGEMVAH